MSFQPVRAIPLHGIGIKELNRQWILPQRTFVAFDCTDDREDHNQCHESEQHESSNHD